MRRHRREEGINTEIKEKRGENRLKAKTGLEEEIRGEEKSDGGQIIAEGLRERCKGDPRVEELLDRTIINSH